MRSVVLFSLTNFTYVVAKTCLDVTFPVKIETQQPVFTTKLMRDNVDVAAFTLNLVKNGHNYTRERLSRYRDLKTTIQISGRFCHPDQVSTSSTVQLLVHGIGFDKSYWDLPFDNGIYSYEDVAVDEYAYCTLSIDRPGSGKSSHKGGLNVIQTPMEMDTISRITQMLRTGTLPGVSTKFDTVIHVGHSLGSILIYSLVGLYPTISDAVILTGFSFDTSFLVSAITSFNLQLASTNQPYRFSHLRGGYMTWSDLTSNILNFLAPGFFSIDVARASEATKQPVTTGELLTLLDMPENAANFTGPVMVLTGELDNIFCGGDCYATGSSVVLSIPAGVNSAFPEAKAFEAYIQPNTGHGINLHYNASNAYRVMNDFLYSQGVNSY